MIKLSIFHERMIEKLKKMNKRELTTKEFNYFVGSNFKIPKRNRIQLIKELKSLGIVNHYNRFKVVFCEFEREIEKSMD